MWQSPFAIKFSDKSADIITIRIFYEILSGKESGWYGNQCECNEERRDGGR